MTPLLLALAVLLQTPVPAKVNDSLAWDYNVADVPTGPVALFLVCVDQQPTSACAQVLETSGTSAGTLRTYTWKLQALTPGTHTLAVQACTAGAAACSSGATLAITMVPTIGNPTNLRLTKGGA